MRLGVLDIGSNTGHLLVFDAHGGAAPLPAYSHKEPLRLRRAPRRRRARSPRPGVDALTEFVAVVRRGRGGQGLRGDRRLRHLGRARRRQQRRRPRPRRTSTPASRIDVLSGEDEARLTFLAVRRWFGWSAGRLSVFDIGGGSLEIAGGADESPDVAWSVPLGAARLAREYFAEGPPRRGRPASSCAARSAPRSPATPASCCAPAARPGGGDVQDVPVAGPDLRCRAGRRRRPGRRGRCR